MRYSQVGIILSLCFTFLASACIASPRDKITLETGGYGFDIGDIVLIDKEKEPSVGDVVQYNRDVNKSNCMAMGPNYSLATIIAVPGDKVIFDSDSYSANSREISFSPNSASSLFKSIMWGMAPYEDAANLTLTVPHREYLADRFLGLECTGEIVGGTSKSYRRLTVKREAVTGVLIRKVGHDDKFEQDVKNRVY